MSKPTAPAEGPSRDPQRNAAMRRLIWTWIQTILGTALMGGLVTVALMHFGLTWSWGAAFLSLWILLPLSGWYFSGQMVKRLMGCRPPNPFNKDHMRLVAIVDRLYPKTGLKVKPPVYVSPIKVPNAFATGRTPSQAFIAATEGLLEVGLTDEELEAVLAHELAHVRNYDVALNSMLAAMGSLFSLVLATGLPGLFSAQAIDGGSRAPLLDELSRKVKEQKKRFFLPDGGVLGFVTMMILFWIVSAGVKFVSLFVTRVRESAADAHAVLWTSNPCALSTALQKIVIYATTHASDLRSSIITRGLSPLLLVNPLDDGQETDDEKGMLAAVRRWWRSLGENHPPIKDRLKTLDKMSGKSCPRIK